MKRKISQIFIILLGVAVVGTTVFSFYNIEAQAAAVYVRVKIAVCGNGIVEAEEQCDAGGSNGACPATCSVSCTTNSCGGGGGGGGGGGVYVPPTLPQTAVNFTGRAYPKTTVTLLKDAQIAATTVAGSDANFQMSISGLSAGNYIFSVYSEDKEGRRSSLLTFPVSITSGTTTNVSGIFISPTIAVDKSEVKLGDTISVFGQTVPNAQILINVNSPELFFKIPANNEGIYLHQVDTTPLDMGSHFARSKATAPDETISSFSKSVGFFVGTKNIIAEPVKAPAKGDLNNDKRVNLVDFSVAAYWYKRPSPPSSVDLNSDGKIDLVDFSIMAYYWTG